MDYEKPKKTSMMQTSIKIQSKNQYFSCDVKFMNIIENAPQFPFQMDSGKPKKMTCVMLHYGLLAQCVMAEQGVRLQLTSKLKSDFHYHYHYHYQIPSAGAQNLCKIMSKSLKINEKSLNIHAKSMKIYAESMTNH